jgi:8-oxo-dGTP pyrophosphatase MutT (NUDIX family)
MTEFARRSARVILLDAADRLLLIRSAAAPDQPGSDYAWFTPGGGVEPGEALADAAARELLEETGLRADPADLTLVAFTAGEADLGWASGLFRDDLFVHRVSSHRVDPAGMLDYERRHYGGHHWWTQVELAATTETIIPVGWSRWSPT